MAVKAWEPIKTYYCQHVNQEVALEVEIIYPADWLPDQSPRIFGHRCSQGMNCNQEDRASCQWAGTNPGIDPFI